MVRNKKHQMKSQSSSDLRDAKDLVDQGLITQADMKRALFVLQEQEDEPATSSPDVEVIENKLRIPIKKERPGTAPNAGYNNKIKDKLSGMVGLPRNWSQARKEAASSGVGARPSSSSASSSSSSKLLSNNRVTTAPSKHQSSSTIPNKSNESTNIKPRKGLYESSNSKQKKVVEPIVAVGDPISKENSNITFNVLNASSKRRTLEQLSGQKRIDAIARAADQGRLLSELLCEARVDSAYIRYVLRGAKGTAASLFDADVSFETANWATRDDGVVLPDAAQISTDQPGISLLHTCASRDLHNAAAALIEYGAIVNRHNRWHETPLHWAASSNAYHTSALLLDFGADVTAQDISGSCPLMRAAHGGHIEIVSLLLSRARGSISAKKLKTALQIVRENIENLKQPTGKDSDEYAAKNAALVLIQRHLRLLKLEDQDPEKPINIISSPAKDIAVSSQLIQQLKEVMESQTAQVSTPVRHGVTFEDEVREQASILSKQNEAELLQMELDDMGVMEREIARIAEQCEELSQMPGSEDAGESSYTITKISNDGKHSSRTPNAIKRKKTSGSIITTKSSQNVTNSNAIKEKPQEVSLPLPLSSVLSQSQKSRSVKFSPANYVPFLHSTLPLGLDALGGSCDVGDVLLAVEQCYHCDTHNFSLWHDPLKYNSVSDRCLIALVRAILDKGYRVRLFALKEIPRPSRIGALEVTCSVCVGDGPNGTWVTHTIHSKLDSSSWPAIKRVASRGSAFVEWAFESNGLTQHLAPYSAKEQVGLPLQQAILEERKKKQSLEEVQNNVQDGQTKEILPGLPGSALKKLQVEGQFMSWLIRLSMSSATTPSSPKKKSRNERIKDAAATANSIVAEDPNNNFGNEIGMMTLDEWTQNNIASFGAFFNVNARTGNARNTKNITTTMNGVGAGANAVGKGKRPHDIAESSTPYGTALSFTEFERFALQHFFVFDNITASVIDENEIVSNIVDESPGESLPQLLKGNSSEKPRDRLSAPSPERSVAENMISTLIHQQVSQSDSKMFLSKTPISFSVDESDDDKSLSFSDTESPGRVQHHHRLSPATPGIEEEVDDLVLSTSTGN
jgi:ankyrin repeat protein